MAAIISKGLRARGVRPQAPVMVLGVDLKDAREEVFVRLACDGLSLGIAYARAGFQSTNVTAAHTLFALPRIQARANAILEARRNTGAVTLAQVTSMLQNVYAGAHAAEEYSAAHNAAFSLARLYGHVTDRSVVETIRRPSRDPDAPSEQALSAWVDSLPSEPALGPASPAFGPGPHEPQGLQAPRHGARAAPLGPVTGLPNDINDLASGPGPLHVDVHSEGSSPEGKFFNVFNDLTKHDDVQSTQACIAGGRPENGAPTGPVTEAPNRGARSQLLGGAHSPLLGPGPRKGAPLRTKQVPVKMRGKKRILTPRFPPAKDLF